MSQATNTKLMDTEPGGENTQYEGSNTFTQSHAKEGGQFNDSGENEASKQAQADKTARGEKTAENVRFGESISEYGFGGETVVNSGSKGTGRSEEVRQTRREQGYGGGSGVGG